MLESGEMYLETILILGKRKNLVRATDVVEYMGYSKASVSRALAKLRADACILVDARGNIALTEKGRSIADKIYERHIFVAKMLQQLGIDAETAEADACKIEHDISDRTFEAMKAHVKAMERESRP